jgi:hypothetical protein
MVKNLTPLHYDNALIPLTHFTTIALSRAAAASTKLHSFPNHSLHSSSSPLSISKKRKEKKRKTKQNNTIQYN